MLVLLLQVFVDHCWCCLHQDERVVEERHPEGPRGDVPRSAAPPQGPLPEELPTAVYQECSTGCGDGIKVGDSKILNILDRFKVLVVLR